MPKAGFDCQSRQGYQNYPSGKTIQVRPEVLTGAVWMLVIGMALLVTCKRAKGWHVEAVIVDELNLALADENVVMLEVAVGDLCLS
jgi:hypothetical protein